MIQLLLILVYVCLNVVIYLQWETLTGFVMCLGREGKGHRVIVCGNERGGLINVCLFIVLPILVSPRYL